MLGKRGVHYRTYNIEDILQTQVYDSGDYLSFYLS